MGKTIHIICEGSEEVAFIDIILQRGEYATDAYEISRFDAGGCNRVAGFFQSCMASLKFDAIFVFIDVDMFKNGHYQRIKNDLKSILGFDPGQVILFTNPCTLQLEVLGFSDEILTSSSKRINTPIVQKCWSEIKKPYGAHGWSLDIIKNSFIYNDLAYGRMITAIDQLSTNERDCPSTSMQCFLQNIKSPNQSWLKDIMTHKK